MSSSSVDGVFCYPDPSLLGRLPPEMLAARARALAAPIPATPAPSQVTAPAIISTAPAPSTAPVIGPVPPPRLSAAGGQRFPALVPGLQAPVEITDGFSIAKWDRCVRRNYP